MFLRVFIGAVTAIVVWTASPAQIQGTDTLYRASDLFYFSVPERESFGRYFDGRPDYFEMLIAVNTTGNETDAEMYLLWIRDIVQQIRDQKFDRLNEVKKINQITKTVNETLLIKFEHQSRFIDLFSNGKYNYFTAASIYAIVLDQLEIPYEIREVTTSIILIAYPDSEKIPIEISGPGSPFFMFAHDTRNNFVVFLVESGTIDEAVFTSTTSRVLFDRYYFANYGLSIREMIGMLYLNSAISYMNKSEPSNAYYQFEKAFILHPSSKTQYLLLAHLNNFLLDLDYYNPRDLGYLIKASRLIGYGITRERIFDILKDIVREVLIDKQDTEGMKYIHDYMQEYITDETLRNDFSFLYHHETGRIQYNDQQYSTAMMFLESAYSMKPEDEHNNDLLARTLGGYSLNANPGMVLEKIRLYDSAFTGIIDHEIFLMIKLNTCLAFFGEAFQLQDVKNGEHYMAVFEEMAGQHPGISIDYLAVGRSYSSAAIYYYRQGRIQKSREVLERGLKYAPHNVELKLKLKSFE